MKPTRDCKQCGTTQYKEDMVLGYCRECWNEGVAKDMLIIIAVQALVAGAIIYGVLSVIL